MGFQFLNAAQTDVVGAAYRGAAAPAGSYAHDVAGAGTLGDPIRLTDADLAGLGVVRVNPGTYDPDAAVVTGRDYDRNPDSTIKIVDQAVTEVLTTQPIDPVVIADREAQRLADAQAAAIATIDAAAEKARCDHITSGDGQAMVYREKRLEAEAYQAEVDAGGTPIDANYPLMAARAARLTVTLQAVADEWNAKAAAWIARAAQIEDVREAAKEAVAAATTVDAVQAVIAALDYTPPV